MDLKLEGKFETVASAMLDDAEAIECSLADYAAGLKIIEQSIRDRRGEVEDEVRQNEGSAT